MSRSTLDPAASLPRFAYGALTLSGRSFQDRSAARPGRFRSPYPGVTRTPVWAPPVSLAATSGITIVFSSSGYLDVSVRRVPLRALWIHARIRGSSPRGFPHSDTCGSSRMCRSPQLFAACRVFHRLPVPRHPPCALSGLTLPPVRLAWRRGCSFFFSFFLMSLFRYSVFRVRRRFLSRRVGLSGLEPPTSRLSGVRSNRLSYKPRSSVRMGAPFYFRFLFFFFCNPAAACFPATSPAQYPRPSRS